MRGHYLAQVNIERLFHLRAHGPMAHAFNFKVRVEAPAVEEAPP